jgi:hypothetical protein
MSLESILTVVFGVVALIGTFVSYYFYIKGIIIKAATGAIDNAEQPDKKGEEKFKEAVDQIMTLIPTVLKPFITKDFVGKLVQAAFEKIESYAKKQVEKQKK